MRTIEHWIGGSTATGGSSRRSSGTVRSEPARFHYGKSNAAGTRAWDGPRGGPTIHVTADPDRCAPSTAALANDSPIARCWFAHCYPARLRAGRTEIVTTETLEPFPMRHLDRFELSVQPTRHFELLDPRLGSDARGTTAGYHAGQRTDALMNCAQREFHGEDH